MYRKIVLNNFSSWKRWGWKVASLRSYSQKIYVDALLCRSFDNFELHARRGIVSSGPLPSAGGRKDQHNMDFGNGVGSAKLKMLQEHFKCAWVHRKARLSYCRNAAAGTFSNEH